MASTRSFLPDRDSRKAHVGKSLARVRLSLIPVLQCSLAAGAAWFVAFDVVGHAQPFFAPIAAVVSLGIALGARLRRSVELVAGVAVGIGVGDLLIAGIGTGVWQIALVVALAMATAVLLDGGPVITAQAASSAVLVATLLPPGGSDGGLSRMVDALIGGLMGIVVVAVVPTHPMLRARDAAGTVLDTMAEVLRDTADGLREQNPKPIAAALRRARDTQPQIDSLRTNLAGGREISRISPLHWRARARVERLEATADPIDNAVRNIRVLVRRSLSLVRDDEILDPRLVDAVEKLAQAVEVVRQMVLADPGEQPDRRTARAALRAVAAGAGPDIVAGAGLSGNVVLAQLRSTIVDLLQVAGMERLAAMAVLPPTVPHPYVEPDFD